MNKVQCGKLDNFGRGIIYQNDKIAFIDNLLPNEEATITITQNKKNYSLGKVDKLLKESENRITPTCSYQNCGCTLKHLEYKKQLEFKENKVKEVLNKFAHITPKINKIVHTNHINNYRNKITLKVDGYLGYHQNNSNKIITIDKCALVSDKINELIKNINKLDLTKTKEITIKEFDQTMLIVKGNLDINKIKDQVDIIYLNEKLVKGKPYVTTKIKDLTFQISKDSFFQVNKYLIETLYDIAIDYLGKDANKKVLDLYCGTGTITLLLSKYFKEIIGIEINKEAIKCANENKKINNINNVSFINGDVSKEINKLKADIVLVDPPRSGLSKEGIEDIIKINPETIVYISCDPVTLARDLNILKENYEIKEITPVDMFPNTYHVENVVLISRVSNEPTYTANTVDEHDMAVQIMNEIDGGIRHELQRNRI